MTETTVIEPTIDTPGRAFTRVDENPCSEILEAIRVVEEHLRKKRNRIEKIRIRHEELIDEINELNKSLESESADFVPKLNAVLGDLDDDGEVVKMLTDMADAETAPAARNGAGAKRGGAKRAANNGADQEEDEKPAKRGSLRWLKEKERSRWES